MRFESTASRVRSSGACHSTISSKVRFGSSIIAHSSPSTSAFTSRSSFPSSGSPSEFASRFAGSIVSTATFFPRAAIPSAMAADVVVLPTPPGPAADADLLACQPVADHSFRSSSWDSRSMSSRLSSGVKIRGRVVTGARRRSPQPAHLGMLGACRVCSDRAA